MTDYQVNDAVHVASDASTTPLEGVVLYMGATDFDSGTDWVGVRLTGASVGQGTNDGTVQGKQYFLCPDNCGIFVRKSKVSKRTLSRLEELRLRRELSSASTPAAPGPIATVSTVTSSSSKGATHIVPGSSTASTRTSEAPTVSSLKNSTTGATRLTPEKQPPPAPSSTTSTSDSISASTSASSKSKLEELRQRRAQLKEKRQDPVTESLPAGTESVEASVSDIVSTNTVSTFNVDTTIAAAATIASSSFSNSSKNKETDELISQLQLNITSLNEKLQTKEKEVRSIETQLAETMKSSKSKIRELENAIREAKEREPSSKATLPSALSTSFDIPDTIQEQIVSLENKNQDLNEKLEEVMLDVVTLRQDLDRERKAHMLAAEEASKARAESMSYQNQLQALTDQSTARGQSDATHYKERAKLQAEISNYKRKIEQYEKDHSELENTIEDLTLDKEQLLEEKESLEDRLEELKLDAETAQMEVEELKMELEDSRAANERLIQQQGSAAPSAASTFRSSADPASLSSSSFDGEIAAANSRDAVDRSVPKDSSEELQEETAEMAQALQVQNARLREALIRLREQSALEKMELTRQLRSIEKQSQSATDLQSDVNRLNEVIANLEEQINDLKDMVEQGAAFEGMVEDLSDRVLSLEEDNVMLQSVLREMEEAAELTAEMEEVQADEIKALTLDMEGRNVIIRNLEEAIKIQRRREDDFRRTVGNYKTTVETLRQEKSALLELQQGGEGEKSDLIASSQKALAKAAQLVADAAAMRKREAAAAADQIEKQYFMHLSHRLESLLPHNVSDLSGEVASIKGELLGAKVIAKSSKALEGIEASFMRSIRPLLLDDESKHQDPDDSDNLNIFNKLQDEMQQNITTMIHQAEFSHVLVDVSAHVLRLLVASQWPDLLSPELSMELGTVLGHALPDLDGMIQTVLRSLKEEGSLTVEQSNIGALSLTVQNTMQALKSNLERDDQIIISPNWNPPGLQLFRDASTVKFSCQGAAAALSLVVNGPSTSVASPLINLYNRIEQCSSQASNVCQRLSSLDIKNEKLVENLQEMVKELKVETKTLLTAVQDLLLSKEGGTIGPCKALAENTLRGMSKLLASLRGANMNTSEQGRCHQLSPEVTDAWYGVATIVHKIRSIDGDDEDINYYIRAHKIESLLREAVENQPKLVLANQKAASLEKSLQIRSKEIAIQNARLSELEKTVAKSSSSSGFGRNKSAAGDLKLSEEYNTLKEENRVLTEAMDVMQREVEMYENEIRALRDQKTPKRGTGPGASSRGTPVRRSATSISDLSSPAPRGGGGVSSTSGAIDSEYQGNTGILEATLFRPALQLALRDASRWKAAAVASSILDLPPLPTARSSCISSSISNEDSKESDESASFFSDDYIRLTSAINHCRMVKTSITLVDLTNPNKSPRSQLNEMIAKSNAATELLETSILRYRGRLAAA